MTKGNEKTAKSECTFNVLFDNGKSKIFKSENFREAINLIWHADSTDKTEPLRILFENTKLILYADKELMFSYLQNNLSERELIQLTECENLYRNIQDVSFDRQIIENGSLWKLVGKKLILISSDEYAEYIFDPLLFNLIQ